MVLIPKKKTMAKKQTPIRVRVLFDRKGRASETNNGSVEIEVSGYRQQVRIATGIRIKKHEWHEGRVIRRIDAARLNDILQEKIREVESIVSRDDYHADMLDAVRISSDRITGDFCDWLDKEIESRTDIVYNTRRGHRQMAQSIRESGLFNSFDDVTAHNIERWDAMIRERVDAQTSVYGYHKRFKVYVLRAWRQNLIADNPYNKMRIDRGRSEGIKYLLESEVQRIEALELDGGMAVVRDMFIFACYTGLAYVDLTRVSRESIIEDGGELFLIDRRQKTQSPYRLMLLPQARAILERYDFNLDRMSNQKCNMMLKAIQAMCGIKTRLTMHVGRHTFATWALSKGIPIEIVSKMLAHADFKVTQIYAKVLQQDVTRGFEQLKALSYHNDED